MYPGMLLGIGLVVSVLIATSFWLDEIQSTLQPDPTIAERPLITVRHIRVSQFDDTGSLSYVLSSPLTTYYEQGRGTEILKPEFETFSPERRPLWTVQAASGWLSHTGDELILAGRVEADRWPADVHGSMRIATESLTFRPKEKIGRTDQVVNADGWQRSLWGTGMTIDLNTDTLELHDGVQAQFTTE